MKIAGSSIKGKIRTENQDSLLMLSYETLIGDITDQNVICVIADGMGGESNGGYASKTAIEAIAAVGNRLIGIRPDSSGRVETLLRSALTNANRELYEYSKKNNVGTVGTTITVACLLGGILYVANVGDSRTYIIDSSGTNSYRFRTKDHSVVQKLVDSGMLSQEEAKHHPRKNEITRALGLSPKVEIDMYVLKLFKGDNIMLCSDGLWESMSDMELAEIIKKDEPVEKIVQMLIDTADNYAGTDNISCILIRPLIIITKESVIKQTTVPIEPNEFERSKESMWAKFAHQLKGEKGA